jgi:magnesium transporter
MIYRLKRESMFIRRCIWPVRDIVNALEREDEELVSTAARPYYRDLYDHSVEALEIAEMLRDMTASLMDIYLSSIANKNNAVMKVLTVVSTIFMPLTFLAGVYGMNFKYMPELEWHYGYPIALLGMLALATWMWIFFKRKGWA